MPGVEKKFIRWLTENFRSSDAQIVLGPGDDACVLEPHDTRIVVSTDSIADGVHFELAKHGLAGIGHKAMAVNLSDMAAMGARPFAATVNLFCPHDFQLPQAKRLFEGMRATAEAFGTTIVGGDTNSWNGPLQISATLLGTRWPVDQAEFWRMDTGQPGDQIFVTGQFGGSILGKHLEFEPRVYLAREIRGRCRVHAATDVTDSLAMDLAELAGRSGCGFTIFEERIPVASAAEELARKSGQPPLAHALYDGEDFELILCIAADQAALLATDLLNDLQLTNIGILTADPACCITQADGDQRELEIRGYVH